MSVAKSVSEVEPTNLDWLKIGDLDGNVWRYSRRGNIASSVVHVQGRNFGGATHAVLVRGPDGKPVLQQEEPGLPSKIVVKYVTPGGPSYAMAGTVEYEQENG